MMRVVLGVALMAMLVAPVMGDLYLHSPPGSNNRNRERSDNRNNGNRLFDSQNNGKGGYAWRGSATKIGSLDYDDIPDPLVYYSGSRLRIEWTNQHACGPNPNIHCQLVIQYACHSQDVDQKTSSLEWMTGLRDGYPMSANTEPSDDKYDGYSRGVFIQETIPGTNTAQNQPGTQRIPDNAFTGGANDPAKLKEFYYEGKHLGMQFGMHEGIDYYNRCKQTVRNLGLYTSDQNVARRDARYTRQNPNANRRGLECPEERDYYPYWRPAPWRDVAILTSNVTWCQYYKDNSQNVVPVGWCECDLECRQAANPANYAPIDSASCEAAGGDWKIRKALGGDAPECLYHSWGRDNHLGNTAPVDEEGELLAEDFQPETAFYDWILPEEAEGKHCVLRLRYNMSTADYDSHGHASELEEDRTIFNATSNCQEFTGDRTEQSVIRRAKGLPNDEDIAGVQAHCTGLLTEDAKPLFERPYVNLFPHLDQAGEPRQLALAINTDQTGRTFQDRSHVFKVAERPSGYSGKIFNLGVRGRKGNIVQAYPAVEYDFTPNQLEVTEDDWVHIQIHGSDFNAAKNANNGEGWRYSDRHNLVEMPDSTSNYPVPLEQMKMFHNKEDAEFWALLGQTGCEDYYYNGDDNDRTDTQNQRNNCAQLNQAANRYPPDPEDGLIRFKEGHYHYTSTRNNCFSNRSQKAQLRVGEGTDNSLSAGETAAVVIGVIAAAGAIVGGLLFYGKKKPESAVGSCFSRTADCVTCQGGSSNAAANAAAQAPTMDYQRH